MVQGIIVAKVAGDGFVIVGALVAFGILDAIPSNSMDGNNMEMPAIMAKTGSSMPDRDNGAMSGQDENREIK